MNENTPAFPMARVTVLAEDRTPHEGMSLRDYFAGQAPTWTWQMKGSLSVQMLSHKTRTVWQTQ